MPLATLLVVAFLVLAVFGPWLEPHDPNTIGSHLRLQGSSWHHLLGTDPYGRDILSRLIAAARVAAEAALIVVLVGGASEPSSALLAGGLGGVIDLVISRVDRDRPGLPGRTARDRASSAILGPSLVHAMLAAGIGAIPDFARVSRGIATPAASPGVRRGGTKRRRKRTENSRHGGAAEPGRRADRDHELRCRAGGDVRVGALVPRPRRAAPARRTA